MKMKSSSFILHDRNLVRSSTYLANISFNSFTVKRRLIFLIKLSFWLLFRLNNFFFFSFCIIALSAFILRNILFKLPNSSLKLSKSALSRFIFMSNSFLSVFNIFFLFSIIHHWLRMGKKKFFMKEGWGCIVGGGKKNGINYLIFH